MSEKKIDSCISEYSFILGVSNVEGIGVFATHDIPKGANLILIKNKKLNIKDIPKPFLKYVVYVNDEECLCPNQFDRMEALWYINHSDDPNVIDLNGCFIVAARDIKEGEELLLDYNQLDEPDEFKEPYFKTNM